MAEVFASSTSVVDELPSHAWQAPKAGEHGYRDQIMTGEHEGTGNYFVTLGWPWRVNTTGDSAYVVVPATMTFTLHGRKVKQAGSVFTAALRKHSGRWLITAWAWDKGTNSEAE
jgi:hypothetical protein